MKLYQDPAGFSPRAKRVRLVCNEVGEKLELVGLDPSKGEWRAPPYLAKNPMGKIPTLEDDGYVLWESPAMLYHVASKHPEKGLIPKDARGMTEVLRWMFWNANQLEVAVSTVAFEKVIKPMLMGGTPDDATVERGTKDFERFAPVLNGQLEGKSWILGDTYTIADISIAPIIEFGVMAGLDIKRHSHVAAWFSRVSERDAWKRSAAVMPPSRQP